MCCYQLQNERWHMFSLPIETHFIDISINLFPKTWFFFQFVFLLLYNFMDCIDKLVLTQTFILQLSLMIFMYLKLRVFVIKYIPRRFGALLCKHYLPVDVFSFPNYISRSVGRKTSLLHKKIIILRNSTISIKIYL